MYKYFFRPLLFLLDAERAHHLAMLLLKNVCRFPFGKQLVRFFYAGTSYNVPKHVLGLTFKNPVGLAAGFDKDAKLIDELACFGFGFIEIGTLTPRPQPGNEKPRLFRLPKDRALINRMGFNNEGVLAAVERLKERKSDVIVGGNIGKNKSTPNEKALDDYAYCLETLYPYVDYFVVNVSSPNTPGLRDLQEKESLRRLLTYVKTLIGGKEKAKPVLLKIAPDLTVEQLDDVIAVLKETKTDGVIATNTTISRADLVTDKKILERIGAGGLSGKPLGHKSTEVIRYLRREMGPTYPIIGVGGIMSVEDARAKFEAGADLIQVYTGFVYEGPGFVKRILRCPG